MGNAHVLMFDVNSGVSVRLAGLLHEALKIKCLHFSWEPIS